MAVSYKHTYECRQLGLTTHCRFTFEWQQHQTMYHRSVDEFGLLSSTRPFSYGVPERSSIYIK